MLHGIEMQADVEIDYLRCKPQLFFVLDQQNKVSCYFSDKERKRSPFSLYLTSLEKAISVESQQAAQKRIPHLINTPAAIRFLSCEPLLEPLDLTEFLPHLDWVIVGGESGFTKKTRPCETDWLKQIVRQCKLAQVPIFVKQLGTNARHQ